MHKNNEEFLQF